jgi:hypothetical protein
MKIWSISMNDAFDPWRDLNIPKTPGSYSRLRVSHPTPHNFFWGKNDLGQCCLIFNCSLDADVQIERVDLKGIELEQSLNSPPDHKLELIMKLVDDPSRDLFRTVCNDIISATGSIDSAHPEALIKAVSTRLKRWQDLLRGKGSGLLNGSQQIGLFGELLFFRDYFLDRFEKVAAVTAWQGPGGNEQDFGWDKYLFEIKTQLSSADRRVSISSLEQLDAVSGEIWLVHQTLSPEEGDETDRLSLLELVDRIGGALYEDVFAHDQFQLRLLEVGYEDNPAYGEVSYNLHQRNVFRVNDNFPTLKRTAIPQEITNASYNIDISSLMERRIPTEDFAEEVFDGST